MSGDVLNIEFWINVFYIEAIDFPTGITESYQKLWEITGFKFDRRFFGISYMWEDSKIRYLASAEELTEWEWEILWADWTFYIKPWNYRYIDLADYRNDIALIKKTFDTLLKEPDIDSNWYCLEMFLNENDLRCLVLLK